MKARIGLLPFFGFISKPKTLQAFLKGSPKASSFLTISSGNFRASNFCSSSVSGPPAGAFAGLFVGTDMMTGAPANYIIDASKLVFPTTTLADNCYYYMFFYCLSLTTAPSVLPATKLAEHCYEYMFSNCTNLTTAPVLPMKLAWRVNQLVRCSQLIDIAKSLIAKEKIQEMVSNSLSQLRKEIKNFSVTW